ncbi:MAG: MoaD/ThiS family protein [Candidatus Aminicenantes bacterium]|nr:MoaD/ThiS family protein [Candidatus Aminicenantes bacterium]
MKIQVKMIGPLMYEAGFSEKEIEVPAATTADSLLDLIKVSRQRPKIVTRNGRAVAPDERLAEGDRIAISPIYSGG